MDKVNNHCESLNEKKIDELKELFKNRFDDTFINNYSKKYYDLFINNIIFEPNANNTDYIDDLYYLGVYYQYTEINYDLMKKYYLQAIENENSKAMYRLGSYYKWQELNYDLMKKYFIMAINKENILAMVELGDYYRYEVANYDLMKKYYLMAIDRGDEESMIKLGEHYEYDEKNYDLMKKYYLQAIEKGNSEAMVCLGRYYQHTEINHDLMEKYYLMAIIIKCSISAIYNLDYYYLNHKPSNDDLQNYFCAIIKGGDFIDESIIFRKSSKYVKKSRIINLFCSCIDNNNLDISYFAYCSRRIINYINSRKSYKSCELKNIEHFIRYVIKLYYYHNDDKKNKWEYKKCINIIFVKCASQIFIEYLNFYYYEYLEKIFAPGGKGYIKTKKHFELIAKQQ
jgi:TPR repeat protein